MAENNQLMKIRSSIERHIGDKVKLTTKDGRKSMLVRKGIIDCIYPSVFTVRLSGSSDEGDSTISFSYTDVLTKAVDIKLYRQQA